MLTESYEYNLDGDRIGERSSSRSEAATYDAGGKLSPRGGVAYNFDADGFPPVTAANRSPTIVGRPVVGIPSASTVEYAYDAIGRRVARRQGGSDEGSVYGDPRTRSASASCAGSDGTLRPLPVRADGATCSLSSAGSQKFYVGSDQVGSPRVVVDADGTVAKRIAYDAYGVETDPRPRVLPADRVRRRAARPGDEACPLRPTRLRAGVRPLHRLRPGGLRGSSRNLYAYAGNSPVSFRDIDGRLSVGASAYAGSAAAAEPLPQPECDLGAEQAVLRRSQLEPGPRHRRRLGDDLLQDGPKDVTFTGIAEVGAKVPFVGGKVGGEGT